MRVGYADPPYPGQAAKHYAGHPDYAGEVDHARLIYELVTEYDGYCLHTSSVALADVLARFEIETGAKPERVCRWLFDVLGMEPDDELVDLFPGTGAVTDAWTAWRAQLRLTVIAGAENGHPGSGS